MNEADSGAGANELFCHAVTDFGCTVHGKRKFIDLHKSNRSEVIAKVLVMTDTAIVRALNYSLKLGCVHALVRWVGQAGGCASFT